MVSRGHSSNLNAGWSFPVMLRDEGRSAAEAFLAVHGVATAPEVNQLALRRALASGARAWFLGQTLFENASAFP